MSCFMCSDCHISSLAHYAHTARLEAVGDRHPTEIGEVLHEANAQSYRARYPADAGDIAEFRYCACDRNCNPLIARRGGYDYTAVLKAASCFAYQACEHDGWTSSRAHAIVEAIRLHALAQLWEEHVRNSPQWNAAPWGFDSCTGVR